jgi:hypothetical protein
MSGFVRLWILQVLVMVSTAAGAQSLWGGTEYGMSIDEVKLAVPNAIAPSKGSRLGNGAQELLRLENVEIVNKRFAASFFFLWGKLNQVTLSLQSPTFHGATLTFNSLSEALRAKYGQEISRESDRGLLNKVSATWMAGRTNINVIAIAVGDNDATLNINYQVRVARDADKL